MLWDVGFQLSFAATLGLIVYSDKLRVAVETWLQPRLRKDLFERGRGPLNDFVLLTCSASVTTLPLLLYHFQRFSVLSLPANLLVLPVQPAIMVLGGISVMAGLLWWPLGALIAAFVWPLLAYTIRVVEALAAVPWAALDVPFFSQGFVFLCYAALLVITVPGLKSHVALPGQRTAAVLAVLSTAVFWVWAAALARPTGFLQLTLLDGEGEALLLETAAGRKLLIARQTRASALEPYQNAVDWLLSDAGSVTAEQGFLDLGSLEVGQVFDLGAGGRLEVVSASPRGAVFLLNWQNFQAVLPLGVDFDQIEAIEYGYALGDVDLLLLADSGFVPLNPEQLIRNLDPAMFWLAGDAEDLEAELGELLGEHAVFDTAHYGWLRVSTDGWRFWFEAQRDRE
jgi:hypothetical protein